MPDAEDAREDSAPRRRRWGWYAGLALTLILILAGGLSISALSVRRELSQGEAALRRARSQLLDGDAGTAEASFAEARARFGAAADGAGGGLLGAMRWLPLIGRTPDALEAIAEVGIRVADAGEGLAEAIGELPGGLDALAASAGRVPVERFPPLAAAVAAARDQTGLALRTISAAPEGYLLGPVGPARVEAEEEIRALHDVLTSGADLLEGMPGFLGADGPRRYFFGAQNPAELRATGGVMGAYSILTIEDGRFHFTSFEPVQSLPIPDLDAVPPPSAEYAQNYDPFRTERRFWLAVNLTPDFPTAAQAILNAYEVAVGERLDGVIVADPFALQALLRVTGPAYVPRLDRTIRAADVVAFTANEAYSLYTDQATRKRVLGAVAEAAFARFLSRTGTDVGDLRVLARAAAEGHILAYSEDPTMQAGLAATGAGGALEGGSGDFLSVVENSAGGTKVDYFQEREVSYEVDLWPGGAAEGTVTVSLTNGAPTTGQPRYVIGPRPGFARLGEDSQIVSVYCAACRLERARRDGTPIAVGTGTELGLTFYRDFFRTPSGGSRRLELTWYLPEGWEGDATGGVYRLTFLGQTTIRPAPLTVEITAPDGMRIVSASPGVRIEGDTAMWEGVPSRRLELEVEFQPSWPVRLWRALTG